MGTEAIRYPKGAECQCSACDEFFSSESAFERHWTKNGHAHPREVGLVERERATGPVWGWPGLTEDELARKKGSESPDHSRRLITSPETASRAPSEPKPRLTYSRPADGAVVGSRGDHGGIVARCAYCGLLWERPPRKGRPAYACEECR